MFFNTDILFRPGPVALMWKAAHDGFNIQELMKNKRDKHFISIIDANVVEFCDIIRSYFPNMGTVNGLSLKNTLLLVKGASVIHLSKIDNFTKNMHTAIIRLHHTTNRRLKEIELSLPQNPNLQMTKQTGDGGGDVLQFGNLHDFTDDFQFDVGPRHFNANDRGQTPVPPPGEFRSFQTPTQQLDEQNTRRRRLNENFDEDIISQDTVLQLLQDHISRNARANCIVENVTIPQQPADDMGFGGPGDFGDFDFNPDQNMQTHDQGQTYEGPPGIDMISVEERERGMRSPIPTVMGDDQGHGRHGTLDTRRNLEQESEHQIEQVGTLDQLASLESISQASGRQRRTKKRRLDIDEEPQILMADLQSQVQAQPRPLNYSDLHDELGSRYEELKNRKRKIGLPFIRETGRKIGSNSLLGFVGMHENLVMNRTRQSPRSPPTVPRINIQEISDERSGVRADGTSIQPPSSFGATDLGRTGGGISGADVPLDFEQPPFMDAPIDDGIGYQPPFEDFGNVGQPPAEEEEDPLSFLGREEVTFRMLFLPDQTSRAKAASGFLQLLKMQFDKKIELRQDEEFGDIFVKKI